jgi:hypothetical protein
MSQTVRIAGPKPGIKALAVTAFIAMCIAALGRAAPVAHENLADLVAQSEVILFGTVDQVSDGVSDERVPFTEVTLDVTESFKGAASGRYRFRQFGQQGQRGAKGGPDRLAFSPPGFPRWAQGERVLVFLPQPARHTGLRTTVGLSRGKLTEVQGQFESRGGIAGLFENLVVEADGLTPDQIDLLNGAAQPVDSGVLLALLRRAVDENWVEHGIMRHADRTFSAEVTAPHR